MTAFSSGLLRTFGLLFFKNVLVRKNQWIGLLINLIVVPIIFIFSHHLSTSVVVKLAGNYEQPLTYQSGVIVFCAMKDKKLQAQMQEMIHSCFPEHRNIQFYKEEDKAKNDYAKAEEGAKVLLFFDSDFATKNFHYSMAVSKHSPDFVGSQYCFNMEIIKNFANAKNIEKSFTPFQVIEKIRTKNNYFHIAVFCGVVVSFLPVLFEAALITNEMNLGVNVLLQMNGVSIIHHLFSWFVSAIVFSFLYLIPLIIILFIEFFKTPPAYANCDMTIIILTFFLHSTHFLCFGYFIASFFSRAMKAKFGIIFLFFVSYELYSATDALHSLVPYLGMFLPQFLMFDMLRNILNAAAFENGVHWSNMFESPKPGSSALRSVGFGLILSLVGTVFYFILTVYIQNVKPGKYGAPKHPLYFLPCLSRKVDSSNIHSEKFDYEGGNTPFESPPKNAVAGIQIRGLKKLFPCGIFSKAFVPAIKDVSIDFYKNHITSLLGHNGAGKTTLMSIITGMTSASGGSVLVNGKNIETYMDDIHSDIGLCPQEDMFFPELTVFQHLVFFGMLKRKNHTKDEITRDVDGILRNLNIMNKRNEVPTKLSGGQKRRLCFGMALIGNATTLILDEPTSGMDPESRREAWDIILGMRAGKTIIITTHDMEEADVLGDRIAIMHEGTLRCDATSMFLKNFYGQGNVQVSMSMTENSDHKRVLNILNPEGKIMYSDGTRLEISTPMTANLPDALDNLESEKSKLGVTGVSVSLMSLEQIFLEISKDKIAEDVSKEKFQPRGPGKVEGGALFFQRMFALFAKKLTYTYKSPGSLLILILFPILVTFGMGLIAISPNNEENISINLKMFKAPEFQVSENFKTDPLWIKFDQVVKSAGGSIHRYAQKNKLIASIDVEKSSTENKILLSCNPLLPFAARVTVDALSNAMIKQHIGDDYSIETNYLEVAEKTKLAEGVKKGIQNSSIIFFALAFFFVSIIYLVHPLKEIVSGLKHLQIMAGVTPVIYWSTMFIFDSIVSLVIASIAFLIMFSMGTISHFTEIGLLYLTFCLFLCNILPISYILSLMKKSVLFNSIFMIYLPLGLLVVYSILYWLAIIEKISIPVFNLICPIFRLCPQLSFMVVMLKLTRAISLDDKHERTLSWYWNQSTDSTFREGLYYTIGTEVLILFGTTVLYISILMMLEYKLIARVMKILRPHELVQTFQTDEMVATEKRIVAAKINNTNGNQLESVALSTCATDSENTIFLAYELSKRYKNVQAVREVNFRVKEKECFGLLGINGAGKSTTFRMLVGEEIPDTGSMYLNGISSRTNLSQYLSRMGYCPQISALLKSLNTMDHLRLFALLRGVPRNEVQREIDNWIKRMNLKAYASQPSGTYSGGNKRRLSVAIAMLAEPSLVLFDEPTTGVDPSARRSLWNVVNAAQDNGQSVILTSHSMEECEALCNRLAIMVNGGFVCLGASQELKQRFDVGFNVHVRLRQGIPVTEYNALMGHMFNTGKFDLTDQNSSLLTYHVKVRLTWRALYDIMNYAKENFSCVEDFVVVSGTLEQLFLRFAQAAKDVPLSNERLI